MAANQLLIYAQSLVKSWMERREDWGEGSGRRKYEACWNQMFVRTTGSAFWSLVVWLHWMTAASLTCSYWLEDFFCWTDLAMMPHPPCCHDNISCPEAVKTKDRERRLKLRKRFTESNSRLLVLIEDKRSTCSVSGWRRQWAAALTELKERSTKSKKRWWRFYRFNRNHFYEVFRVFVQKALQTSTGFTEYVLQRWSPTSSTRSVLTFGFTGSMICRVVGI